MCATELLVNEYRENKRLIEELTAMNEDIKINIILAMEGKDKAIFGAAKVSNTTVKSTKFDSTGFKKEYPELYKEYSKETSYTRFTIS